ncbi:GyrI-like domain-containing protein [Tenacibaculum holothuriorum]|uniref:GyrI-like domain-containing protein n=1 Tax=Tenacibaculum holothuriorum TaxID=1635173 RepID=UPI000A328BD7|nr:GyrI-like domain-containing protein [Tenacibaculum holothuriorum]
MKILKYTLLFLLALIAVGLIYVTTYTGSYDVQRSKIINVPVSHAFNTVNDLKTWEKWGPWHDEDTTIVVTYGDKTVGVGASDSWTSKQGPGKMETVALETNKSIDQKISFMDNDPGDIYWKFKEVDGGTKVTWGMKADKSPFGFKLAAVLLGGWDPMLGSMEENGLNNLERVLLETTPKTEAPKYTLGNISPLKVTEKVFIGYPHKIKINHDEMTKLFINDLPKAGMHAYNSGLKEGDYTPGAVFSKYDEASGETEFYIGLLLNKNVKPAKGMETLKLPAGNAVMIPKFGNYGVGDLKAHEALDKYFAENKLERQWPIWELYVNDPSKVKPEEIQTDIYYPVK